MFWYLDVKLRKIPKSVVKKIVDGFLDNLKFWEKI
jgi:hypothetical protein